MLRKVFVFTLSLVLALGSLTGLGLTSAMAAQGSSTGKLSGTVAGPDGVIAGATVVLTDNMTGKETTVTSNQEGGFEIPLLNIGTYTVKVTAQGFKTFTATEVKIDVGKEYRLNAMLEVGNITESVTVQAGAEVINSANAELSTTVSQRQIQELPLNGRNPLALVSLQAGTSNSSGVTTINGQRTSFTNITRDGVNVQDNFIRSNATDFVPDRPNVDDVGEFTIVTQNAGAELGYGSAQIQLVTPRGSNQFHGAGYIYNRNSEFAANSFFNNAVVATPTNPSGGIPRPYLNRNQFGGRIGGPIIKDKIFFFGAYEGFRLRQSTSSLRTILTPAARQGVFSYLDNTSAAAGGPIRRTVNVLSLSGLSADPLIASRILAGVPTSGNDTGAGDQFNTTGFRLSRLQNQDREAITSRFDYEINQNHRVYATYAYKKEFLMRPDVDGQPGGGGAGYTTTPFGNQDANTPFFSSAYSAALGANLTNEVRGGFQFSDPKFDRTAEPTDFFIQIPLISSPESAFQKQGRNTKIYNFQDNAVWLRGVHSFRFGGQAQLFRINPYGPGAFGASTIPTWVLGTNSNVPQTLVAGQFPGGINTAQLGTANQLMALLAGIVSSGNQTFNVNDKNSGFVPGTAPNRRLHYENYSGYFADQWRLKPNLTVNLGLRYELFTGIREPNGLLLEPAIGENDPVASIMNPAGIHVFVGNNAGGNKMFKADRNNFAPIISFAWSPDFKNGFLSKIFPGENRTVFRGGYRESYVNDEFVRAADNALLGNAGLSQQLQQINLNARFSNLPSFTTPLLQVPRTFAQNNAIAANFGTVFAIDPDIRLPRVQEYNFGIERELGANMAMEIRYVGGRSSNLIRVLDFNQVDIFNNGFVADFNRALSNMRLTGNPGCTPAQNPGCQTLTVFPRLGSGGLLNNATIRNQILGGTPADLAIIYVQNGLTGTVQFLGNRNAGAVDLLFNSARYNYNSLQTELRRRFSNGLYLQANYTFSKVLADAAGVGQTRVDPPLNLFGPEMEYNRAPYDQTHVFNLNSIYELPFGKGKPFVNQGGWVDRVVGGFQFQNIMRWNTGTPLTFTDARGTFNRAGRSASQTALTSLNKNQIRNLLGVFNTKCGIFYINPAAIDINLDTCNSAAVPPGTRIGTGRGSNGFGTAAFQGQVFFNNNPGQTSGLERAFIDGPISFNWDASIIKKIPIKESVSIQLRLEAFNVLNTVNWGDPVTNVNSTNFGRITGTGAPRIVQLVGRIEF
jgi:hypothetical protein